MKTNLTNWLCGFCVILLIIVLAFQRQQQSRLNLLQRLQESLPSAVNQQLQQQHDWAVELANQVTNLSRSVETFAAEQQSRFGDLQQQQAVLSQNLEQAQKAESSERAVNFREMRQQLDDLVTSGALFPNKSKPAREAVELARDAEQAGDMNLAKIFYLSAINHAPSEFSILDEYAKLLFRDTQSTTEDYARLKSVLQISLYQIPPASISNALSLLAETTHHEEQLLAAQAPQVAPVNWAERFEQLTDTIQLDSCWMDTKQLAARLNNLDEILESVRDEQPDSILTESVGREFEITQHVLTATRLASALDVMLKPLDSSRERPEKAVSLLQAAEATLAQLWGIDPANLPSGLRAKIDEYPKQIQGHVEAVAEIKSRPFLTQVEAERNAARNFVANQKWETSSATGGTHQKVIQYADACLERAVAAAQQISSIAGRKKAEAAIQVIREITLDSKRQQFDAYQKWVVGCCKGAFNSYDKIDNWYKPTIFDKTARKIFDDAGLVQVDQSLLAPETARLFDDVLRQINSHMSGSASFEIQKDIAEKAKKKLEDF